MNLCGRNLRRVTPEAGTCKEKPPLLSRVNGWSLPLNTLQVVAWTTFLAMTFTSFGIFIPLLPRVWRYVAYSVTSGLFLFHFVVHLVAISTDPAEPNVRIKNYNKPVPVFDRSKHAHVIQNQYCHLCEVTVSAKAKHCSACNKCVADFDHHCKWLNNCVGSRNYWCFFSSVASAVAGLFCLVVVLLYILIQYIMDQEELRTDPHFEKITDENTWLLFLPFFPVRTKAPVLLIIGAAMLVLDLVSLLMLGHLLLFHLYLLVKRLSTFDYMTQGRQLSWKTSEKKKESSIQMGEKNLQKSDESLSPSTHTEKPQELWPPPVRCPSMCSSSAVHPASTSQLKDADDQYEETAKHVIEKDEENGGTNLGVESPSLTSSFNLEAFSSIQIPPGEKALESLMLLYSLNPGISNMTSQELHNLLQKTQQPQASVSTIMSNSSKEEEGEEQVIREVYCYQTELSEGPEEEALGSWVSPSSPEAARVPGVQGETSPDVSSHLYPEPGSSSGEALEPGPGSPPSPISSQ